MSQLTVYGLRTNYRLQFVSVRWQEIRGRDEKQETIRKKKNSSSSFLCIIRICICM